MKWFRRLSYAQMSLAQLEKWKADQQTRIIALKAEIDAMNPILEQKLKEERSWQLELAERKARERERQGK